MNNKMNEWEQKKKSSYVNRPVEQVNFTKHTHWHFAVASSSLNFFNLHAKHTQTTRHTSISAHFIESRLHSTIQWYCMPNSRLILLFIYFFHSEMMQILKSHSKIMYRVYIRFGYFFSLARRPINVAHTNTNQSFMTNTIVPNHTANKKLERDSQVCAYVCVWKRERENIKRTDTKPKSYEHIRKIIMKGRFNFFFLLLIINTW